MRAVDRNTINADTDTWGCVLDEQAGFVISLVQEHHANLSTGCFDGETAQLRLTT